MTARILILKTCATILRLIGHIFDQYQLIALIVFIISTTGPHIRVGDPFAHNEAIPCVYLGSRGFLATERIPNCPLFVILNSAKEKPTS